jgi:phage terminase large subunit-like protein
VLAGRGFGKTRTGAEWVRERIEHGARSIALVGRTPDHIRTEMIEGRPGIPGLQDVFPPHQRPDYQPGLRRVLFHTGAMATAYSAAEPDQLRGAGHDTAWCDELAAWMYVKETWDNLVMTMRAVGPVPPQICVTTTPKPVTVVREMNRQAIKHEGRVVKTGGSTFENVLNVPPQFLAELRTTYEGTSLGQQELYANVLDQMPGALWKGTLIEATRIKALPVDKLEPVTAYSRKLKLVPAIARLAIGIDPAVSAEEGSNETGIVCACIDHQKPPHGYVLADVSGRWTPEQWGTIACGLLKAMKGDRIIAEANQGGALVERNLRVVNPNVPVTLVHATSGKHTRAEPVASLYETGRVHHVGFFPELEDQMRTWEPGDTKSPDRLDALVWVLSELLGGDGQIMLEAMQLNF